MTGGKRSGGDRKAVTIDLGGPYKKPAATPTAVRSVEGTVAKTKGPGSVASLSEAKRLKAAKLVPAHRAARIAKPQGRRETELRPAIRAESDRIVREASGIKDPDLGRQLLSQACRLPAYVTIGDFDDNLAATLAFLREMQPTNVMETLLAIQMRGVHEIALIFLNRAAIEGQTVEGAESCTRRATNLMRLFAEQLEAMAKLKGKTGQQRVTVEHVHVHPGGQAIVGAVATTKAGHGEGDK